MIDSIYQLLKTIINKELRGNITPSEFNLIAKQVQEKIFREYFEDENRDKNTKKAGLTNRGYSNLDFLQRQKLDIFSVTGVLTPSASPTREGGSEYVLPESLYNIKDRGLSLGNIVPQETESTNISFVMGSSKMTPSSTFPIYEKEGNVIIVYPTTTTHLNVRYVRKPLDPKWTYTIVSGTELYNNSATDFQDFELHPSEYYNITIEMLSSFGVNLREIDIVQYSQGLKSEQDMKEQDIRQPYRRQ